MADLISEDFVKNRVSRLMKGRDELKVRDTRLPGFLLRCRRQADGNISRVFMIDYVPPLPTASNEKPKRKWMTIGTWPTFSAEEAREEARRLLQAKKLGDDPKAKKAQKLAQPIFEQLWALFEKEHLIVLKPSTRKSYEARYKRMLLPAFAGRRVADITRSEINSLKIKHRNRAIDINRSLATLSKMMSFAMVHEMRNDNPCSKIQRFSEKVCESWLDENDLPAFLAVLNEREGPLADFIRFLAVTGWRISVARELRWDQVDLKRREVHLEESETKSVATVISADASILISRQPLRLGYIFSRRKGSQPLSYKDVRAEMAAICKEAGIAKITPHALRRSAATHGAIAGAGVAELMQSMGWKTPSMALRYVKRSESIAKQGAEKIAGAINVFAKPSAEIIALKR
jgi:integrase